MSFGRRDIQNALNSLRMEGRSIDELEGLLINTDDLTELLRLFPEYHNGMSRDRIRLFGVRIIESQYTLRGTVFRIFKDDHKVYSLPPNVSGTIPTPDFQTTVPGSGTIFDSFLEGKTGLIQTPPGNMKLPMIIDEKKKEKKKKKRKHSKTRKIELD